jgi:DNA-repair protein XRCC3
VYVHTDGPAPTALMRRIASSARFVAEACDGDEDAATAALERVYVVKALGDADALRETLTAVSAVLRAPVSEDAVVRMIVVDSIAAPFRDDATNGGWTYAAKRAGALHKLTMLLKEYATKHDVAVVVTNHVVDSVRENGTGAHGDGAVATRAMGEFTTSGRRVVPALGLMWSNCVNARLFLTRRATRGQGYVVGGDDGDDGNAGVARTLHVVYAPHLPESSVDFVVREDGAWDVAAPRPRAVA